jgi:hypothetical protein
VRNGRPGTRTACRRAGQSAAFESGTGSGGELAEQAAPIPLPDPAEVAERAQAAIRNPTAFNAAVDASRTAEEWQEIEFGSLAPIK